MSCAQAKRPPQGILFVLPWKVTAVGGVNQVVVNLIRQANRRGAFRPILLEIDWNSPRPTKVDGGEAPIIRFRLPSPTSSSAPVRALVGFFGRLPSTLWHLRRILRANAIAAVNAHYPTQGILSFWLLKALGLYRGKLILSVHGLDIRNALASSGFERWLWRLLYRCADNIVACSNSLRLEVLEFEPRCGPRTVAIHNGVDWHAIESGRDNRFCLPELDGVPYVLSVGKFEHKKGQDLLLTAFARLAPEFPQLHLVLVGASGPTLASLREQAAALGVAERVHFHVDVPHRRIPAFFERATVFCLPSRAEPFGIVLLEAALYGVPVIAARVGGVVEIMRDGVHGCLVAPEDPTAFESALRRLLTDRELCQRFAAAFAEHVRTAFTWDKAFNQYAELV